MKFSHLKALKGMLGLFIYLAVVCGIGLLLATHPITLIPLSLIFICAIYYSMGVSNG